MSLKWKCVTVAFVAIANACVIAEMVKSPHDAIGVLGIFIIGAANGLAVDSIRSVNMGEKSHE